VTSPRNGRAHDTAQQCARILAEVEQVIVGKRDPVTLVLLGILAAGHILIEDLPGLGKTLLARTFAGALGLQFTRVQFTPDMLPADLTGAPVLDPRSGEFSFRPGPVFTNLLLADEINRTPPKTQAALLEAMAEGQVSVDGTTHVLAAPFIVLATDNPIEYEGTYPLPEAQLDRFLFKIIIDYPSRDEEREIVARHGHRSAMPRIGDFGLAAVVAADGLAYARQAVTQIRLTDVLIDYIVDVARATREHTSIEHGASTRAANMLASSSRAYAATQGRDFVIPDDIKALAVPLLRHRVVLSPSAEIEGLTSDQVIRDVLDRTAAPR
jgi:MoxR-like ATPase